MGMKLRAASARGRYWLLDNRWVPQYRAAPAAIPEALLKRR